MKRAMNTEFTHMKIQIGLFLFPLHTINPFDNGSISMYFDDDTNHVTIAAGTLYDNAIGYIYKLPSDPFKKTDDNLWL